MFKRVCEGCGKPFETTNALKMNCTPTCRKRKHYHDTKVPTVFKKKCPICGIDFETSNARKSICSDVCRQRKYKASTRGNPPERTTDEHIQFKDEGERLRKLRQEVSEKIKLAAYQQRVLDLAREIIPEFDPKTIKPIKTVKHDSRLIAVPIFSDWHIGQQTIAAHTGEVFHQDSEIAGKQIEHWIERFRSILDVRRKAHTVTEVYPLFIGDMTDGLLRERAAAENDMLHMRQSLYAMTLMDQLIQEFIYQGLKVKAHVIGGNHDRTSRKPGLAALGELAYEEQVLWLIGQFIGYRYKDHDKVDIKVWDSFFGTEIIGKLRVVFEHGSSFKWSVGSYGGVPYYGIVNTARGYTQMLEGADLIVMGHGHTPMLLTSGKTQVMMNGALPPASSFSQSAFKQVIRPCQVLLWIHPERGLISWEPIWLDVGQIAPAGATWDRIRNQ